MNTDPSQQAFNDWDLTILSNLPVQVLAVSALALVVAVALSWQSTRGAPTTTRVSLLLLRIALAVAVFVVLLEPGRRLLATSKDPNRVVVAVDTSASMSVGDGAAQRSRVAARAALDVIADLQTRDMPLVPEVWVFDQGFRVASVAELEAMKAGTVPATGTETRLSLPILRADDAAAATGSADAAARGLPLGAVVIISDGADTTGLTEALNTDLRERIAQLGSGGGTPGTSAQQAPVHTVVVGADARFRDVVLERAIADEFAFVRNPVTVEVVIRQRGFGAALLPLTLAEDGVVVARSEVTLGDGPEQRVTFTFTPQRAGKRLYTVAAPVLDGEAIAENNRLDFTIKLIRDRIRVLQVAGRPSWDERFVRRLLKENPSVDLISFFILRSPSDISGAPNSELSLIPFPTRELFTEQLSTFDVVIFQDFNYRPYNMGIYLQNVADYVKGGGGFLMMGGDLSFSEGDYEGTPLADVLPVRLLPGRGHIDTDDFIPTVTDIGRRHPITDVSGAVASTGATDVFGALPPLQGINRTAGLIEGASALLTHPFHNGPDGQPQPVIAVADVNKGRSVAIMTDTTWHWSLPQVGGGGGRTDAHRKLLANTLRWLIRDPELSRVKLSLDADARGVEPGTPVVAEVRAQDNVYQPEAGATVKVQLIALDGSSGGVGAVAVPAVPAVPADAVVTGKDGSARVTLFPNKAGAWRVQATVTKNGQTVGVDDEVFVVRQASLERLFGEARPELMGAIAAAGGGQARDADTVTGLPVVDHGRVRIHRQRTEPIWSTPWALLAIVGLAAVEWWWRRRRGFA